MAPWPLHWLYKLIGWTKDEGDEIVAALPEPTRRFVRRLQVPPDQSSPGTNRRVVYLLATEALSEQSAADAGELVRVAKPGAVIVQIGPGILPGLKAEEDSNGSSDRIPTNALGVIRECFLDAGKRSSFETRAGIQVLRTIFGTTNHGHILSAKYAARESKAAFLYLETPELERDSGGKSPAAEEAPPIQRLASFLLSGLNFGESNYAVSSNRGVLDCPDYAAPFYPLLVALQATYQDLPGMSQALEKTRGLLFDVERGQAVDQHTLVQARGFRLAVEGLRVALNEQTSSPYNSSSTFKKKIEVEELPRAERPQFLLAQALRDRARSYGTVVAVVDAGSVDGICKFWSSEPGSPEVLERARECFLYEEDGALEDDNDEEKRRSKKLVVGSSVAAVSVAAAPWWVNKAAVVKAAAVKRAAAVKVMKAAVNAGKARAAAQGVVAAAERAALSAVRTAVYSVMRRRAGMPAGGMPWAVLSGSVAVGAGIIWGRERLEAAIEAVPAAAGVARLGRGLQELETASSGLGGPPGVQKPT